MENLMKPAEYAKTIGISRQAVYAKIKKGILQSKNVEGKLYIVVDEIFQDRANNTVHAQINPNIKTNVENQDYKALLEAKDETISVLKGTVKDLKKSNKQISSTLKGEIDLLKDAFHEMRSLYVHQLALKTSPKEEDVIEVDSTDDEITWIGIKKFFKKEKILKNKKQEKILKRINKLYNNGDERFNYTNEKFKLNIKAKYKDILN